MRRSLLILGVVLLISVAMTVPAFAQEADQTASVDGVFTADTCPTLQQDATVWDLMIAMFPSLAETCGT